MVGSLDLRVVKARLVNLLYNRRHARSKMRDLFALLGQVAVLRYIRRLTTPACAFACLQAIHVSVNAATSRRRP